MKGEKQGELSDIRILFFRVSRFLSVSSSVSSSQCFLVRGERNRMKGEKRRIK